MTGPEHYREAERLLTLADRSWETEVNHNTVIEWDEATLSAAQVHATLALVAATAEPIAQALTGDDDTTIPCAWAEVIS